MTEKGYPFHLIAIDNNITDAYQTDTLVYGFQSKKSGHQYQVRIERYVGHLNCIKFFDETSDTNKGKFSQLSGTYEPRTIFRTVAEIAFDALKRDTAASFVFIGAADEKDKVRGKNRRYRVYTTFLKDLGISEQFHPVFFDEHSVCLLVNTKEVSDIETYVYHIMKLLY